MISDCFKKKLEILCCGHISEINGSNPTYVMSFFKQNVNEELKIYALLSHFSFKIAR